MHLKTRGQEPAPKELSDWNIVLQTGWTFEYIDSLSMEKYLNILRVRDGINKARS